MTPHVQPTPTTEDREAGADLRVRVRSIRIMHLLERVAVKFNAADVPLLVLKGAALNLTLYDRPEQRPMTDLDLLIRPERIGRACALFEELGGLRSEPLVREDFFPRFHYEVEYRAGHLNPVKIDLHVRPLRPLRYSRLIPDDALWARATPVRLGQATVLVPGPEDMLIHLAAHAAVHGDGPTLWIEDLKHWIEARQAGIDWERFLATVEQWHLALPVRRALARMERQLGPVCPQEVLHRLEAIPTGWQDRLALWQAPRDFDHPVAHVLVNVLCTPGWRFRLRYLWAVLFPSRDHMAQWYCPRHRGWLACAYLLRCCRPILRFVPRLHRRFSKFKTDHSRLHGRGVFAMCDLVPGEIIARYRGRPVDRDGMYVGYRRMRGGTVQRYELTGKLRFLNHCCRPNARLSEFRLTAIRPIRRGEEVTIDYGVEACGCRQNLGHAAERIATAAGLEPAWPVAGTRPAELAAVP